MSRRTEERLNVLESEVQSLQSVSVQLQDLPATWKEQLDAFEASQRASLEERLSKGGRVCFFGRLVPKHLEERLASLEQRLVTSFTALEERVVAIDKGGGQSALELQDRANKLEQRLATNMQFLQDRLVQLQHRCSDNAQALPEFERRLDGWQVDVNRALDGLGTSLTSRDEQVAAALDTVQDDIKSLQSQAEAFGLKLDSLREELVLSRGKASAGLSHWVEDTNVLRVLESVQLRLDELSRACLTLDARTKAYQSSQDLTKNLTSQLLKEQADVAAAAAVAAVSPLVTLSARRPAKQDEAAGAPKFVATPPRQPIMNAKSEMTPAAAESDGGMRTARMAALAEALDGHSPISKRVKAIGEPAPAVGLDAPLSAAAR